MSTDKLVVYSHKPGMSEASFFLISGFLLSVPMTIFFESSASSYLLSFLSTNLSTVISAVLIAPFMEEFAKIFPMLYRHGETGRSLVTLSFLIGLGFGISEFITYVFIYGVPFYVRIPLIFFHASTTSIVAYGISLGQSYRYYFLAVFLHFLLNAFAVVGSLAMFGYLAVLASAYALSYRFYTLSSSSFILQGLVTGEDTGKLAN
jgi:RsiW-degrading membrane proteinase PrsW (M82 family)